MFASDTPPVPGYGDPARLSPMAYDGQLAQRVRAIVGPRSRVTERKMFGGVAWMVEGNMACGVLGDEVIIRMSAEESERALAEPGTRRFDFTGRPMRGFVVVGGLSIEDDAQLAAWIDAGADYASSLPPR